jgi:hypothetical protein
VNGRAHLLCDRYKDTDMYTYVYIFILHVLTLFGGLTKLPWLINDGLLHGRLWRTIRQLRQFDGKHHQQRMCTYSMHMQ